MGRIGQAVQVMGISGMARWNGQLMVVKLFDLGEFLRMNHLRVKRVTWTEKMCDPSAEVEDECDELVAANVEKVSTGISACRGEAEAASCRPEAQGCAQNGDAITPDE